MFQAIKEHIEDWEWEDAWQALLYAIIVGVGMLIAFAIISNKTLDYYYLDKGTVSDSSIQTACVMAHWTWSPNETVFCTVDPQQALEFVTKANATLPKGK